MNPTRYRQAASLALVLQPINEPETPSEPVAEPVPTPPIRRKWSRLACIAGVLALPSFITVILLPGWLFQRLIAFEMEGIGPVFLALVIAIWVGFLGSIFGGLALRHLQGPEPEKRGRAWAVFATVGSRGLLMVVGGALGSVVLGRGGVEGGDPEFLLPRWIAGMAVTLVVAWAFVRFRLRRVRLARRGRGWWVFGGGLLLHLLLIASLPFALFQAWVTFRPEVVRGGGQHRKYEGPQEPGLYAQRELKLIQKEGQETTVILRLWEKGAPRELGRRSVRGDATLEWRLVEGPAPTNSLSLKWSLPATPPMDPVVLSVPPGKDLGPVLEPRILHPRAGTRTNLWIFQDFDSGALPPAGAAEDHAIEVLLETLPQS